MGMDWDAAPEPNTRACSLCEGQAGDSAPWVVQPRFSDDPAGHHAPAAVGKEVNSHVHAMSRPSDLSLSP